MGRHSGATQKGRKNQYQQKRQRDRHRSHDRQQRAAERSGGGFVVCPSGKPGFSEHVANARLAQILELPPSNRPRPVRTYECNKCGAWHLTSRPEPPARTVA